LSPNTTTFRAIASRYRREVFPRKAPQTQRDKETELKNLEAVFGDVPIDKIKPHHVRRYLDTRGLKAKVRANREKALLSHVFNCAREWGYTDAPNPCAGVKGHREAGRDRYVEDSEFRSVYERAHFTVQDAMDLAYLTSQRPVDVLKLQRSDIRDGALWITEVTWPQAPDNDAALHAESERRECQTAKVD
jgi:integrase